MNCRFANCIVRLAAMMTFIVFASNGSVARGVEPAPQISAASVDSDGFQQFQVRSAYQAGETIIRVLLPEGFQADRQYRVMFVLPVLAGPTYKQYGDGLDVIRRAGLHTRHQLICVSPSFSHLPWYADHPTNREIRQESYLLKVVLPWVREKYPIKAGAESCLLLGFSKSGWGAYSLLLRHPDLFGRAAAWDAPLNMAAPSKYGMSIVFENQQNFEPYRVTTLLERHATEYRGRPARFGLFGYGNFREQHTAVHDLMQRLEIPHEYRDGPARDHTWDSGWVPEAVEFLTCDEAAATK
jgi:S-formylglutathione hydrolase FrmB